MGDWCGPELDKLRDLWARGLTASQIAEHFPGRSRNAVIGKVRRLHLPGRPSPIRRAGTPRPAPTRPAPVQRGAATLPAPAAAAPPAAPPAPPARPDPAPPPPAPPRVSTRRCCWPIDLPNREPGMPRYRSCDAPVEHGARLAYCPEHYRRAISPRIAAQA